MENEKPPIEYDEKENKGFGCVWLMLGVGFLIVIVGLFIGFGTTSNKPLITKDPPEIEIETTLTGILFNIQAKDNYKYVIFEVELLDKNDNVAKSFTMRTDNLKKGELKQLEYKFSLGEIFTSEYIKVRIKEYK